MLFTSFDFVEFFFVVYALYLAFGKAFRVQNLLLVVASYVFYGYWDWRFCGILAMSTTVNYLCAVNIDRNRDTVKAKRLMVLAVTVSLTALGFFKYFNFFASQLNAILSTMHLGTIPILVHMVLPVGMSFYTFKEISYIVDVYRGRLEPERNPLSFALYVSFFAQLVAGPIERGGELLPQINQPRRIKANDLEVGIFLIVFGYWKKLFIADNLALIANRVFDNYTSYHGLDLVFGIVAYAFQIYCDFSGYSDIARGVARLFGFHLPINFKLPYFATNPSDFWTRWHVTLSQWLRDYLYIPLGGSRKGEFRTHVNLMATMLLGGLWHGASWNFVAWGGYHGAILVGYHTLSKKFALKGQKPVFFLTALSVAVMFVLTLIGWVCFRGHSLDQIQYMLTHVGPGQSRETMGFLKKLVFYVSPLLLVEVLMHRSKNLLVLLRLPAWGRLALYFVLVLLIILFGARGASEFIYFQF